MEDRAELKEIKRLAESIGTINKDTHQLEFNLFELERFLEAFLDWHDKRVAEKLSGECKCKATTYRYVCCSCGKAIPKWDYEDKIEQLQARIRQLEEVLKRCRSVVSGYERPSEKHLRWLDATLKNKP